jgi:hypothetical protein
MKLVPPRVSIASILSALIAQFGIYTPLLVFIVFLKILVAPVIWLASIFYSGTPEGRFSPEEVANMQASQERRQNDALPCVSFRDPYSQCFAEAHIRNNKPMQDVRDDFDAPHPLDVASGRSRWRIR